METPARSTPRKRILVVHPDPAVTEQVERRLHALYRVASVHDPRQALAVAHAVQPDAVVCGLDMPGFSGGELQFQLAQHAQTRHIPVLLLADDDIAARVAQLIADAQAAQA